MKNSTIKGGLMVRLMALLTALVVFANAQAGMIVEAISQPYGTYNGVDYLRHTGRFVGTTSKGAFRVPFEIVAPADPSEGNGTVVFEPPHFLFGAAGRDATLGSGLLFDVGFSHASVGFSNEGFSLLNPFIADALIAGGPVIANAPPSTRDVEILQQFAEALISDPTAVAALGDIERRYAYGVSQTAAALFELFFGPGAEETFDLTVLFEPLWNPGFVPPPPPLLVAELPENFAPLSDIGKVMIISTEGDLLISEAAQLRNATSHPDYRVYEVAGAPHLALDLIIQGVRTNALDAGAVVRAAFVAGDRWARGLAEPPPSQMLASAAPGEVDPVYWLPTGIARDLNGNAAGGIRFPDVETGRAFHLASAVGIEIVPGLPGLIGLWFDLACAPAPGSNNPEPRFRNHGSYVSKIARQAAALVAQGYLLAADAELLIEGASESEVGKPGSCGAGP